MKYSSSKPENHVYQDDYDRSSDADSDYQQSLAQNTSKQPPKHYVSSQQRRTSLRRLQVRDRGKQPATVPPTRMSSLKVTWFFAAASAAAAAPAGPAGSMNFSDTMPRATKNAFELLDANAAFESL